MDTQGMAQRRCRFWGGRLGLLAMLFCTLAATPAWSQDHVYRPGGGRQVKPPDLKTRLETGLKARRNSEFAFIARVVTLVQRDLLPLKLVNGSFNYARKKASYNRRDYPMVYFQRALELQSEQAGIDLYQPLD